MKNLLALKKFLPFLIVFVLILSSQPTEQVYAGASGIQMKKYVSEQANFVLYILEGWGVSEGAQSGFRTLFVTDPSGMYIAAMFYGINPKGNDLLALTNVFVQGIRQQFPDFRIQNSMISRDGKRIVFDGFYTDPQKRKKEFRCWITGYDGNFIYSSVEAPEGQLAEKKPLLLTILSNVRVIKGAFQGAPPKRVPLVQCRLPDGSAYFQIPQDWRYQGFGAGALVAKDPSGFFSFIVGSAEAITPQVGVNVRGVQTSPYLPPHRALQFFIIQQGLASDMRFIQVIPRQDITQQISQVYTAGPVTTEEFFYTYLAQGRRCKGYTFGVSFGSRLNVNWKFWHISVGAPLEQFDSFAPNFVAMVQSYRIDDQFAMNYIAQGTARLHQMQQQTVQMVARNRQEISQMMQAAYDERQRSMDYIDYQRTNYIRGQQDWISHVEGGTVYNTDSWGTKNTATGEFWGGQPYNYFNFKGENPKYNEQMTPIDSRQLYEGYIRGRK